MSTKVLTLQEFLATQKEDLSLANDWGLTEEHGYKRVLFFYDELYIHQYVGWHSDGWQVLLFRDEEEFNTIAEAAEYLYNEFYLEECV